MEKMINKDLVKSLRIKQAWSQEQLAEVSGLSLRTIQRIEKDGKCSLESIRSLCSVLNLNPAELVNDSDSVESNQLEKKGSVSARHLTNTKLVLVLLVAATLITIGFYHQKLFPRVKQVTFLNQGVGHKSLETYVIDFNQSSVHRIELFDGYWLEASEVTSGDAQYLFKLFSPASKLLHQSKTSLLTPTIYKVCDGFFHSFQSPATDDNPICQLVPAA